MKLYEHSTSLLHAKTAMIDKVWSTVGSTNMDYLSLLGNDEVNAIVLDHEFAGEMEKMFVRDLANSRQIQKAEWKNRPVFERLRTWFVHLFPVGCKITLIGIGSSGNWRQINTGRPIREYFVETCPSVGREGLAASHFT